MVLRVAVARICTQTTWTSSSDGSPRFCLGNARTRQVVKFLGACMATPIRNRVSPRHADGQDVMMGDLHL